MKASTVPSTVVTPAHRGMPRVTIHETAGSSPMARKSERVTSSRAWLAASNNCTAL
ncbi:MAG TPA: hypothetical protein VFC16_07505 [Nakamurella sp.]|nr:hypothetical protein [Nakamurella sp.]